MYSVYTCQMNINAITTKITNYENAKVKLQAAKSTCSTDVQSLGNSINKITGDLEVVKKDDVFEGEMANTLATRISTFKSDTNAVKTDADAILTAIDSQIAAVDSQITTLNSEKSTWQVRLSSAEAEARRQAQERMRP